MLASGPPKRHSSASGQKQKKVSASVFSETVFEESKNFSEIFVFPEFLFRIPGQLEKSRTRLRPDRLGHQGPAQCDSRRPFREVWNELFRYFMFTDFYLFHFWPLRNFIDYVSSFFVSVKSCEKFGLSELLKPHLSTWAWTASDGSFSDQSEISLWSERLRTWNPRTILIRALFSWPRISFQTRLRRPNGSPLSIPVYVSFPIMLASFQVRLLPINNRDRIKCSKDCFET